ncbi:MAG: peptidoglycan-associated lipoprotein, partial [Lysobacterales bacterium]
VSYGEERPVCRVSDEECWSLNRRVEIVYTAR